jgi:HJR/Mrr/RecB family endonuclease
VVVGGDFITFDEKLDKLLDYKRELSHDMLNGSGDLTPADFADIQSPDGGTAYSEEYIETDDLLSLSPDSFEVCCALLWVKQGYSKTFKTPKNGDGGVDVVAIKGNQGVLIQCKSSGIEGKELGWEAVKDVSAGAAAYRMRYPQVQFELVAVTNRRFNQVAKQQSRILNVTLVEGEDLQSILKQYPIQRGELDRFSISS